MKYISELAVCPLCDAQWTEIRRDGREGSRLIGIYSREQDRTVAWRCPGCGHEWPRGARIDGSEQ